MPRLELLNPGSYRLELEFRGCLPIESPVEIRGGELKKLELWLQSG